MRFLLYSFSLIPLVLAELTKDLPEVRYLKEEQHLIHEFTGWCNLASFERNPDTVTEWLQQTFDKGAVSEPTFDKIHLNSHSMKDVKPGLLRYIDHYLGKTPHPSYAHPGKCIDIKC